MLPLAKVKEIRRLLDEGKMSQRKIALALKVSRGIVGAIASGKRGIYGKEPKAEITDLPDEDRQPERCPSCGGMVYMPCVLCRARAYRRWNRRLEQLDPQQPAQQTASQTAASAHVRIKQNCAAA